MVPFKVYDCSSYLDRNRPTWKQMEELAIDILPLTSSKPAGFHQRTELEDMLLGHACLWLRQRAVKLTQTLLAPE